ncbi:MAG: hypothetical protein JNK05_24615 [Myxococcales bacterium]|nr:hypothetical protein [Myxococcales bacterium]
MARLGPTLLLAGLGVLGASACDTGTHYSLRDTDEGAYRTSCWQGRCRESLTSPMGARPSPSCAASERAGFALAGAYVVSVCHACFDGAGRVARYDLSRCRAVSCQHPTDCPPWHRGHAVECREGLCVEKETAANGPRLDRQSAAALCMAGAGSTSQERFVLGEDRLAFARAACDAQGRCAQPAGCRQAPR